MDFNTLDTHMCSVYSLWHDRGYIITGKKRRSNTSIRRRCTVNVARSLLMQCIAFGRNLVNAFILLLLLIYGFYFGYFKSKRWRSTISAKCWPYSLHRFTHAVHTYCCGKFSGTFIYFIMLINISVREFDFFAFLLVFSGLSLSILYTKKSRMRQSEKNGLCMYRRKWS